MLFGQREIVLPFSKVSSLDDAWNKASLVMVPEIAEKYKKCFELGYLREYDALKLLEERYIFYLKLLENDPISLSQYGEQIGSDRFYERVVFAVHNTLSKSGTLVEKLNTRILQFSSLCLEDELKSSIDREFSSYGFSPSFSNCEKTGVCSCRGKNAPYMSGCISDDSLLRGISK